MTSNSSQSVIILNQSNNLSTNAPNTLTYTFPFQQTFKNKEVALNFLSIPYSWPNVTSSYNNNSFSYIWTNGSTYNVTMPNGFYQVSDINNFLELTMISNGHYLVDSNGNQVFYINIQANSTYYCITFTMTPIPSSLPSGWSNPNSITLNGHCPQIVIPSTNITTLLGVNAGTYPSSQTQANAYGLNGQLVPQVSPVTVVNIACNISYNPLSTNQKVLYSFTPNVSYGDYYISQPQNMIFFEIPNGTYPTVTIQFLDNSFNLLPNLDNSIQINLVIRERLNFGSLLK
jgi:hypothetical protein